MSRRHGFDWEILGLDDDTWRLAVREHVCGVVTMMTMRRGPFEYYSGCGGAAAMCSMCPVSQYPRVDPFMSCLLSNGCKPPVAYTILNIEKL